MRSMTGFGRASEVVEGRRLSVEIRSVNGRGLDVKLRGRDLDGESETSLLRRVRDQLERGSVIVTVDEELRPDAAFDTGQIRAVHAVLDEVRIGLGLDGGVDLATVAAFLSERVPGSLTSRRPGLSWHEIASLVEQALTGLIEARTSEGDALARDLGVRAERLARSTAMISARAVALPAAAALRLTTRIEALVSAPLDPARLAQEVALLADRLDVSEELVRLETHLARLASWLKAQNAAGQGGLGRRLEFLIQEIGREFNTVASKTQDVEIATLVVNAKAELEKIREQAQNIE